MSVGLSVFKMGDQDYNEEEDPQGRYQYLYDSSQPTLNAVPKSGYLFTNYLQDLALHDQSQATDVVMQDFPHSDVYVAPAEAYTDDWQSYRTVSNCTTATSFTHIPTPSATTDSSYVIVPTPSHTRTYSENSSGQGSDGSLLSVPGDPEPWTPGSAFAVDREAMDREALEEEAQSPMLHDQDRILTGLSSPGTYTCSASI
jgi:hypothetical protein